MELAPLAWGAGEDAAPGAPEARLATGRFWRRRALEARRRDFPSRLLVSKRALRVNSTRQQPFGLPSFRHKTGHPLRVCLNRSRSASPPLADRDSRNPQQPRASRQPRASWAKSRAGPPHLQSRGGVHARRRAARPRASPPRGCSGAAIRAASEGAASKGPRAAPNLCAARPFGVRTRIRRADRKASGEPPRVAKRPAGRAPGGRGLPRVRGSADPAREVMHFRAGLAASATTGVARCQPRPPSGRPLGTRKLSPASGGGERGAGQLGCRNSDGCAGSLPVAGCAGSLPVAVRPWFGGLARGLGAA